MDGRVRCQVNVEMISMILRCVATGLRLEGRPGQGVAVVWKFFSILGESFVRSFKLVADAHTKHVGRIYGFSQFITHIHSLVVHPVMKQ